MRTNRVRRAMSCLLAIGLTSAFISALPGWHIPAYGLGNPNPGSGIKPPHTKFQGKTYGEWAAAWQTWVLGIPKAENPIWDLDGRFGDVGQSGSVWFLAGAFGGEPITRTVEVPAGMHLFFPLVDSLWLAPDDIPFSTDFLENMLGYTPAEVAGLSDAEIVAILAAEQIDYVDHLSLIIDGVPVGNLADYRAITPPFKSTFSDVFADFGYPPGPRGPIVSDGYWILMNPLPVGTHTIEFSAGISHPDMGAFSLHVKHELTVVPRGRR